MAAEDHMPIRSDWIGWADEDKCPLCRREAKGIANVWKKGHSRGNGIILDTGLSYCEQCADTPECEEHWKKWWAEQWRKQEERCEVNWQKFGVIVECQRQIAELVAKAQVEQWYKDSIIAATNKRLTRLLPETGKARSK